MILTLIEKVHPVDNVWAFRFRPSGTFNWTAGQYVSGPEPMVRVLSEDLVEHGLPEAQLKRDEFPNYDQTNY